MGAPDWIVLNKDPRTKDKFPWRVVSLRTFRTGITGFFYACPYYTLATNGALAIHPDYIFNGNTGLPLWFERRLLPMMLTGACLHDALYQLLKLKILPRAYRSRVDALLYAQWLADKTPPLIAETGYSLVKAFGWMFI